MIADALLSAGVLEDYDYHAAVGAKSPADRIEQAVNAGLIRWTTLCGAVDEGIWSGLTLTYTDDVNTLDGTAGNLSAEESNWADHFGAEPGARVGAFALDFDQYPQVVTVGRNMERLLRTIGKPAWDVYRLMCEALYLIDAGDPAWAKEDEYMSGDDYKDAYGTFLDDVPEQAWEEKFNPRRFGQARLRGYTGTPDCRWAEPILRDARTLALAARMPPAMRAAHRGSNRPPNRCHLRAFGGYTFKPLCIEWQERDGVRQLADQYNEMVYQDEYRLQVWAVGFDLAQKGRKPGTLWWAVEMLKFVIPVLSLANRILVALHHDPRLENVFQERVQIR